jgi:hypothetical protein
VPLKAATENGKGVQKGDILDGSQDIIMDVLLSASQGASEGLLTEDGENKAKVRQKYDTLFFVRVMHVLHLTAEQ